MSSLINVYCSPSSKAKKNFEPTAHETLMTISSMRNKARRGEFIFGACSKDIDDLVTSTKH
jgi:hypothetical protein